MKKDKLKEIFERYVKKSRRTKAIVINIPPIIQYNYDVAKKLETDFVNIVTVLSLN